MPSGLNKAIKAMKVPSSKPLSKRPALILSERLEEFFASGVEFVVETEDEADLLVELMSPSPNQVRHSRFGASSRGNCPRRQIFAYLGMPRAVLMDGRLANIFIDGKLRHIKWQLILYKLGLVDTTWPQGQNLPDGIETKFTIPAFRLSVSLDASLISSNYFVEVKGMWNYKDTMTEINHKHNLQMHTCMMAARVDTAIYIPEEKGSNDWREVVVHRDEAIIQEVKRELNILNEAVDDEVLPPVKTMCKKKLDEYNQCEFSAWCLAHESAGDPWPKNGQWAAVSIGKGK